MILRFKTFEKAGSDPLEANQDAYNLYVEIATDANMYCMDNKTDKKNFLAWLEENISHYMTIKSWPDIQKIIRKNTSWCTDNEGDMRAFLSVIFEEDLMGEYAEDYEPFDELVKMYEGTWSWKGAGEAKKLKDELEKFKDKAYDIVGDDLFFDGLDSAISRLEDMIKKNV